MEKKLVWLLSGWLANWCINIVRLSLLVVAINKNWQMPLGLYHTYMVYYCSLYPHFYNDLFLRQVIKKLYKNSDVEQL